MCHPGAMIQKQLKTMKNFESPNELFIIAKLLHKIY